jgi:hypothetical protein
MATSLIYGGIMGAILASMPAVETHVVAFNHEEEVDFTEHCSDPVDLLIGVATEQPRRGRHSAARRTE